MRSLQIGKAFESEGKAQLGDSVRTKIKTCGQIMGMFSTVLFIIIYSFIFLGFRYVMIIRGVLSF